MRSYLLSAVILIAHVFLLTTAAIDESFLKQANSTLSTLREKCMHSWLYENPQRPMKFPAHYMFPRDAHEHNARLKAIAGRFRQIPPHGYAGYSGPWVENIWIKNFEHLPIEAFGGMIPLFFNWVDGQLKDQMNIMISVLTPVIRPNVLYVTVSQSDESIHKLMILHPNILVLSAGGFGHVPLPLIKGEADYRPPPSSFLHDVAFIGTDREERHELIIKALESAAKVGFSTTNTFVKDWKDQIYGTKYNLSPRGYGRSSFRFSEIIQMGRIPIHLYNDISWIPYVGTNISLDHYGFEANVASIPPLMTKLKALSNETVYEMFQKIKEVRPYYTYEGVMEQIKLFLGDPLGPNGGYLRCAKVPRTVLCCGRR